jgi:hypothetical protein
MGPARIYRWRRMHRSRAPSIAPGTFFVAQPWADCITNMDLIYDRHTLSREGLSDLLDDAYILAAWWPDGDAQVRGAPIDKRVADHCRYDHPHPRELAEGGDTLGRWESGTA